MHYQLSAVKDRKIEYEELAFVGFQQIEHKADLHTLKLPELDADFYKLPGSR